MITAQEAFKKSSENRKIKFEDLNNEEVEYLVHILEKIDSLSHEGNFSTSTYYPENYSNKPLWVLESLGYRVKFVGKYRDMNILYVSWENPEIKNPWI